MLFVKKRQTVGGVWHKIFIFIAHYKNGAVCRNVTDKTLKNR